MYVRGMRGPRAWAHVDQGSSNVDLWSSSKYLAMDDALNITEQICHRFEFSNHLMFFPQLGVIISAFRSHRCRETYSTVSLNESHISKVAMPKSVCRLTTVNCGNSNYKMCKSLRNRAATCWPSAQVTICQIVAYAALTFHVGYRPASTSAPPTAAHFPCHRKVRKLLRRYIARAQYGTQRAMVNFEYQKSVRKVFVKHQLILGILGTYLV